MDSVADFHEAEVADPDRGSVVGRDDNAADLLDVRGQPEAVHEHRLAARDDPPPANVAIVRLKRFEDVVERQPIRDQPLRLDDDMELLVVSPP